MLNSVLALWVLRDTFIVCHAGTAPSDNDVRELLQQLASWVDTGRVHLSVTHRGSICAHYTDTTFEEPFRVVYLTEPRN